MTDKNLRIAAGHVGTLQAMLAPGGKIMDAINLLLPIVRDARRYQWLRDQCQIGTLTIAEVGALELKPWSGDDPDTAIDRAMP